MLAQPTSVDPNQPKYAEEYFSFRLARDLCMTVADMDRRMPREEFTRWIAFYAVESRVAALHQTMK